MRTRSGHGDSSSSVSGVAGSRSMAGWSRVASATDGCPRLASPASPPSSSGALGGSKAVIAGSGASARSRLKRRCNTLAHHGEIIAQPASARRSEIVEFAVVAFAKAFRPGADNHAADGVRALNVAVVIHLDLPRQRAQAQMFRQAGAAVFAARRFPQVCGRAPARIRECMVDEILLPRRAAAAELRPCGRS